MNPVFVVGAPRSGTSYLARSLALANNVAYWEEAGAFSLFGARAFPLQYASLFREEEVFEFSLFSTLSAKFVDRLRSKDRLHDLLENMVLHTKLDSHDLEPSKRLIELQHCRLDAGDRSYIKELNNRLVRRGSGEGMRWTFREMFSAFRARHGGTHVLEKTPAHFFYIPVIKSVFPDAKFIMLVRNKRDCASSHIATFDPHRSLARRYLPRSRAIESICKTYVRYMAIENWISDNLDVQTIQYDDFIASPLEHTLRLCDWAGFVFDSTQNKSLYRARTLRSKWDKLDDEAKLVIDSFFPE